MWFLQCRCILQKIINVEQFLQKRLMVNFFKQNDFGVSTSKRDGEQYEKILHFIANTSCSIYLQNVSDGWNAVQSMLLMHREVRGVVFSKAGTRVDCRKKLLMVYFCKKLTFDENEDHSVESLCNYPKCVLWLIFAMREHFMYSPSQSKIF